MNKKVIYTFTLLVVMAIYGFLNFGNYLAVTEKPVKADLIVCLGGGKGLIRIKKSLELYRLGYAQKNILLVTGGTKGTVKNHNADDRMAYIDRQEDNISEIYNPYTKNTAEEILFIKEYMKEYNYTTVLVVSEPPYARRIKMLADIFDMDENVDMIIVSSEPKWWNSQTYYLNKYASYMALSEFVKIPYNYLLYGMVDKLGYLSEIQALEERLKIREKFYQFIKTYLHDIEK